MMKKLRTPTRLIALLAVLTSPAWASITAVEVIHADVNFGNDTHTDLDTIIGEITRDTGPDWFDPKKTGVVTPWNSAYSESDTAIIASGTLTVKLSDYVKVSSGIKELGIFTAQMYNTSNGELFYGNMGASIHVSKDGVNWAALNNGDAVSLNTPALGYQFPNNILPSWSQYDGPLSDLEMTDQFKPFDPSGIKDWIDTTAVLEAYGNSAGGNWFDLSGTGLDRVLYVKLEDIHGSNLGLRLDGFAAIPEPATLMLLGIGGLLIKKRG